MRYNFSLDGKSAITLVSATVFLLLLVFGAGLLTGIRIAAPPGTQVLAHATPQPAQTAHSPVTEPKPAAKVESEPPQAAVAQKQEQPAASTTAAIPKAASPEPAKEGPPGGGHTEDTPVPANLNSPRLTVQVGSFLDKSNAERLAARLRDAGYSPQLIASERAGRLWHTVRVGPYSAWEDASQIADTLSRGEECKALVRPIR